ncbi:MAG: zf-HC2 domain-containing protein [Actinomycetota bacterium]
MNATGWHADDALLDRYAVGAVARADAASVEAHVLACAECRARLAARADVPRLERNFEFVLAELDAPRRGRVERVVVRLGVPEHVGRLMAATPALRWSWFAAILIALLFVGTAVGEAASADETLQGFLLVAPLVPVLGVALCYGPRVDPTHEIAVAAPIDGFGLLMIRSMTVLVTSMAINTVLSLTQPGVVVASTAWLVPALALSTATLALSSSIEGRVAAGIVAGTWVAAVVVVDRVADDPLAAFGLVGQAVLAVVAVAAAAVLLARRRRFAMLEVGA